MTTLTRETLEHRVQQLEDEVRTIYDLLFRIEATQRRRTNRLGEINTRLDHLDAKTDDLGAKLDEVLRRLEP